MSENKTFGLEKNIHKAQAVREMCQTAGFKVLQESIKEEMEKATKKILDPATTDESIKYLRQEVGIWSLLEKKLKQIMLTGALSKMDLDNLEPSSPDDGQGEIK